MAGMPQFSAGAGFQGAATIFPSRGAGESFAFRRTRLRGRPNIAGKRGLGEGLLKGQTTLERKLWEVVCPRGGVFLWPQDCNGCCGPCPVRYRLHFERDSREEVERRKRAAREQVLQPVSAEVLELDIREVYQPGSGG